VVSHHHNPRPLRGEEATPQRPTSLLRIEKRKTIDPVICADVIMPEEATHRRWLQRGCRHERNLELGSFAEGDALEEKNEQNIVV